MAWRTPPVVTNAQGGDIAGPEDSRVPKTQKKLLAATRAALEAVAEDVRTGLSETVGIGSTWVETDRSSVALGLPPGTDTELISRAIDLENVEAWLGEDGRVYVGIGPWYSTKDVDQVVLSITKVVHVMLGLHASDVQPRPKGIRQKLLSAVAEVWAAQKRAAEKKE